MGSRLGVVRIIGEGFLGDLAMGRLNFLVVIFVLGRVWGWFKVIELG